MMKLVLRTCNVRFMNRNSPIFRQNAFLSRWRLAGGPNACIDEIMEDDDGWFLSVVRQHGDWSYYKVGEKHFDMNGFKLEGALHRLLSAESMALGISQNSRIYTEGRPFRTTSPGMLRGCQHLLGERIAVPVRPPKGADRAVVSYYVMHKALHTPPRQPVLDAIATVYGNEFAETFATPGLISVQAQLELVRSLKSLTTPQSHYRLRRAIALFEEQVFSMYALPATPPDQPQAAMDNSGEHALRLAWTSS